METFCDQRIEALPQVERVGEKVMLISADRVAYLGFIGQPRARQFGSLTVYVSLGRPFQVRVRGGDWERAMMFTIAPECEHDILSEDLLIGGIMIEPETIDLQALPAWLVPGMKFEQITPEVDHLRRAFKELSDGTCNRARTNIDEFFFGQRLKKRYLDQRVTSVIAKIIDAPWDFLAAETCSQQAGLSCSRFLHLFKDEVGITFRSFRAWKRARTFLTHVNSATSLTNIALTIGYPDSSYFSNSVRRFWGLTPRDIMDGSRRLKVISAYA